MAITLNDNLKINVGNPIDSKYLNAANLPYSGTTAVIAAIPLSQRYRGLTVNVNDVSNVVSFVTVRVCIFLSNLKIKEK